MTIQTRVRELVSALQDLNISDNGKTYNALQFFKETPVSGISLRIDKDQLQLPYQMLIGHLDSMGYNADIFYDLLHVDLDKEHLAAMISYHELSEILIGDVPSYTPREIAGTMYRSYADKKLAESKAVEIIVA